MFGAMSFDATACAPLGGAVGSATAAPLPSLVMGMFATTSPASSASSSAY
jgi:hypothetical protein